jgi:beta-xylosidase
VDAVSVHQEKPTVIHIKPGTYAEQVRVGSNLSHVVFEGEDAATTIITGKLGANDLDAAGRKLGTFRTATVFVDGDDFFATNITFENSAGEVGQAVALSVSGDRCTFRKCRLIGWQDTLYLAKGRQYFAACTIEGHTDYIFGGATSLFENCEIRSVKGSYIAAPSTPSDHPFGFVFKNCKLTGGDATLLGRPWRPWGATAYIDCEMGPLIKPIGWDNWRDPSREKTARFAEYKSTGPGANPEKRAPWSHQLTDDEATKYTIENIFAGEPAWNPKAMTTTQPTTQAAAYPWIPDRGDDTYANPVLCADYSDPDAIRVGDDFWLTSSSFTDTPGLPILQSRDLVNWTIVNHALENVPGEQYNKPLSGCGVWAPSIRFHDDKFWIFFPTPDEGVYVTTATDPRGKWSEPHLLLAGKGIIDPCPLWDDDGKAYLVHAWARSRSGIKHRLTVRPMSPDGMQILGDGQTVFEDPQRHPTMEGPKFYKRDGWYYILAPAGGVPTGWQVALRSKRVFGPYEDKIVLEQGETPINGPHQGALLDTPSGEWWFLHFQESLPYGRIVHLQPVQWTTDGWPMMGIDRHPVLTHAKPKVARTHPIAVPQTSDEFDDTAKLGLQWQWHANHKDDWYSVSARPGWLRLFSQPVEHGDFAKASNVLLQKLPAKSFTMDTLIDAEAIVPGTCAGIIVMGKKHGALSVERRNDLTVVFRENNVVVCGRRMTSNRIRLRLQMSPGGECMFACASEGGELVPVNDKKFQAVEGVWVGAKVGLFCIHPATEKVESHADFDYFRFAAN